MSTIRKTLLAASRWAVAAVTVVALASQAQGANGTWTNLLGGTWGTAGNWSGGTLADGTGAIADFSTLNITAHRTVNVDSARTVGTLRFGDTTPSSHIWSLDGSASKYLTLAASSGSPTVSVSNVEVFLGGFKGTGGLVKTGNGVLAIFGNTYGNSLTGPITVKSGLLASVSGRAFQSITGDITVESGASFEANAANDFTPYTSKFYLSGMGGTPAGYVTGSPSAPDGQYLGEPMPMGALDINRGALINGTVTLVADSKITHGYNDSRINGAVTANAPGKNLELAITVANQYGITVSGSMNLGTGALTVNSVQNGGMGNGAAAHLNAANSYSGGTVLINFGTVKLGNAGALGSGGVTLSPNTWINLNAQSVAIGGLSGTGGSITDQGAAAGTTTLTVNQALASTFSGVISNGTNRVIALVKSGSGTLALAGLNTYTGATTVAAGKLVGVTGGACANSAVTVADGATNGIRIASYGGQWSCAGLTHNAGATALEFDFGTAPVIGLTAPLQVNGDLVFNGTVDFLISNGIWVNTGTYPLVSYTGTLSGSVPAAPVVMPSGMAAALVDNTADKRVDLVVTAVPAPVAPPASVWTRLVGGNGSGQWGAAGNWSSAVPNAIDAVADFSTLNITANSLVTNEAPRTVGSLLFRDAALSGNTWTLDGGTNQQLTLAASVGLPSITVTNGEAFLGGFNGTGGLAKNGNGVLAFYGKGYSNVLSGPVFVNGGVLATTSGKAFKYVSGEIFVAPGATFEAGFDNDFTPFTNNIYLSGTGGTPSGYTVVNPATPDGAYYGYEPTPLGALDLHRSAIHTGSLTLMTDSKITHGYNDSQLNGPIQAVAPGKSLELAIIVSGQNGLTVGGSMNLGTGALTVNSVQNGGTGNGFAVALNAANSYSGGTVLTNYATLKLGNAGALGSGGVTLFQNSCMNLNAFNVSIPFLEGPGGMITDTNGTAGVTTLTVSQSVATTFSGVISNGPSRVIALVKKGAGSLTLAGTNTYTGATLVSNGTLCVNGALGSSSVAIGTNCAFAAGTTGTVGRASLSGSLTFQSNSRLLVDVMPPLADAVAVAGDVVVGAGVELRVRGDQEHSGSWKVIEAITGTVQGSDLILVGGLHGAYLTRTEHEVWLTVPERGTAILVR